MDLKNEEWKLADWTFYKDANAVYEEYIIHRRTYLLSFHLKDIVSLQNIKFVKREALHSIHTILTTLYVVYIEERKYLAIKDRGFTFLSKPVINTRQKTTFRIINAQSKNDCLIDLLNADCFLKQMQTDRINHRFDSLRKPKYQQDEEFVTTLQEFILDEQKIICEYIGNKLCFSLVKHIPDESYLINIDDDESIVHNIHYVPSDDFTISYDAQGETVHICKQQNMCFKECFKQFVKDLMNKTHVWEVTGEYLQSASYLLPKFQ